MSDSYSDSSTAFTLTVTSGDPYLAWQQVHFGPNPGPNTAPHEDYDGDGIINLLEYAFGTNPTNNAQGPVKYAGGAIIQRGSPVTIISGPPGNTQRYAVFCRRVDHLAAGLTYAPLFTYDLQNKVPSAAVPDVLASDGEIEVVAVPYPASIQVNGNNVVPQFFQVAVSKNP